VRIPPKHGHALEISFCASTSNFRVLTKSCSPTSCLASRLSSLAYVDNSYLSRQALTVTMRLTSDLISHSLSYLNPLKERELDLRGAFWKEQILHFDSLQSRIDSGAFVWP
jgi:hypothetical protein